MSLHINNKWTIGGTFTQEQLRLWKFNSRYFYKFYNSQSTLEAFIHHSDNHNVYVCCIDTSNKEFIIRIPKQHDRPSSYGAFKFTHYVVEI